MPAIPCKTRVEPSDRCVCDDLPLVNMSAADRDIPWEPNPPKPRPPMFDVPIGDPPTENPPPSFCVQPPIPENCFPETPEPPEEPGPDPGDPPIPSDPLHPPQSPGDPNSTNPVDPGLPHPPQQYGNTESNCIAFCPGNTSSATAIVPANTFFGESQFAANFLASNVCVELARQKLVCLSLDSGGADIFRCEGTTGPVGVTLAGPIRPETLQVTGLPSGITWNPVLVGGDVVGFTLNGTWTPCGYYTIAVTLTSTYGEPFSYTIPLTVMGIAGCDTLPVARMGVPYSGVLTGCACNGPCLFTTTFPMTHGLSISLAGVISGTPTGTCPTTIPFTVEMEDANGNSCTKDCSISLEGCACPDWNAATPTLSNQRQIDGGDFAAISVFEAWASCLAGDAHPSSWGSVTVEGTTVANGTCCIRVQAIIEPDTDIHQNVFYSFSMTNLRDPVTCLPTSINVVDVTAGFDAYYRTSGLNYITWSLSVNAGPQSPGFRDGGKMHVRLIFSNVATNACADGCPP